MSLPLPPIPSLCVVTERQAECAVSCNSAPLAAYLTHGSVCLSLLLFQCFPLSPSPTVSASSFSTSASPFLQSSALEGGSKNQAPGDGGARLAVWVPHPQPLSALFAIQQSLPQLLIVDRVPYKGGLLVACPGSGTAGSLCAKKKKSHFCIVYLFWMDLCQTLFQFSFSCPPEHSPPLL